MERQFNALGAHVHLSGVNSLSGFAEKVLEEIVKTHVQGTKYSDRVKSFFKDRIEEVGFFGLKIKLKMKPEELNDVVNNFSTILMNLMTKGEGAKADLIFLVIDDINGLASNMDFANWLKNLCDSLRTSRLKLPLVLLFCGLPERRHQLIKNQPSLSRIFDLVNVGNWSNEETATFFKEAFESVGTSVEDNAIGLLSYYANGLPTFAHEIGEVAFNQEPYTIDLDKAGIAITSSSLVIGAKYIDHNILHFINSPTYKSILVKISEKLLDSIERKELEKSLKNQKEKKGLDNFLRRMTKLGVLKRIGGQRSGKYEFTSRMMQAYFFLKGQDLAKS